MVFVHRDGSCEIFNLSRYKPCKRRKYWSQVNNWIPGKKQLVDFYLYDKTKACYRTQIQDYDKLLKMMELLGIKPKNNKMKI